MSPTKKFFSGNTLEQAVLQAARFFKLDPEGVAYEPVERRHGFLKVRRRVVIGVDPENPERGESVAAESVDRVTSEQEAKPSVVADEAPTPEPPERSDGSERAQGEPFESAVPDTVKGETSASRQRERRADAEEWKKLSPDDATEAAEEALRRVFRLGDLELSAEITTSAEGLGVELSGRDEDSLFEDRGRLLLALQHLLPRMVRGLTGVSVPCRVDSDNFHEVRAEQLRMLAQDAADEVRREQRAHTLEPMSPDERRIVHLTLAEDPAVETESHGSGLFKRVAVRPVRSAGGRRHDAR